MDFLLAVVLVSGILCGCRFLMTRFLYGNAGWTAVREARHTVIAQRAMQDIDRKYEELLRR